MRKIITTLGLAIAILAISGCTLTNEKGEKVVLTASNAFSLIWYEMKKGCPTLMVGIKATIAITTAMRAAEDVQGALNDVSNMASIGCSLLVPPPVAQASN